MNETNPDSISTPATTGLPTQDERTWGMLAHLTAFAFFICPFGNIIGPRPLTSTTKQVIEATCNGAGCTTP